MTCLNKPTCKGVPESMKDNSLSSICDSRVQTTVMDCSEEDFTDKSNHFFVLSGKKIGATLS